MCDVVPVAEWLPRDSYTLGIPLGSMVEMSRSGVRPPAGTFLILTSFFQHHVPRSPHYSSPSSSIFTTALFFRSFGDAIASRIHTQSTRPTASSYISRKMTSECSCPTLIHHLTRTTTHISLKTAKATRACMHGAGTRIVLLFGLLRKMDLVARLNGFEIPP